jgi:DNA-binding NtrC family response regulator
VLLAAGPRISAADLPFAIPTGPHARAMQPAEAERITDKPLSQAREEWLAGFERRYLDEVLRETGGRVGAAAARAGITPRSLYEKMRRLGLRKETFRGQARVEEVAAATGKG